MKQYTPPYLDPKIEIWSSRHSHPAQNQAADLLEALPGPKIRLKIKTAQKRPGKQGSQGSPSPEGSGSADPPVYYEFHKC